MASETRMVHLTVAPELAAYLAWLDAHPPLTFDADEYDLFASGYRAALEDQVTEAMLQRAIRIAQERPR